MERAAWSARPPRWNRRRLRSILTDPAPTEARRAARRGEWIRAHRALADHFAVRDPRFLISPRFRSQIRERILGAFPTSMNDAAISGDRLLAGRYDLLGFSDLRFDQRQRTDVDWHLDPVYGRRAPILHWASVPYLEASCGDHKIIWELNRHQHWLVLGRAFWLTSDRRYRDRFLGELSSWMAANPPLTGINWASMLELALRSLSWIWALNFFAVEGQPDDQPWTVDLLIGIDRQLTQVERNLSYYFSPNTHLLGEALALYVAGRALPELTRSSRWETVGRGVLVGQMARQINADGGACERSTHYHRYTLDFYLCALEIARVTRDPIAALFERAVSRLAAAARHLCDDRGFLPRFGDDDGGMLFPITGRAPDDLRDTLAAAAQLTSSHGLRIGRDPEEVYWQLSHPTFAGMKTSPSDGAPPASAALEQTGYYVSRSAAGEHLVIDGGPHGFLNGGHAHADALSLALSIRGIPLLIDPGTACYTADRALRDRFRSTMAHNTVVVDDRWQSVPSGPFHWRSTTDAIVHRWRTTAAFDYFDASHAGYAPIEHRRRILSMHADLMIAADFIGGDKPRSAVAHWHIGPGWKADVGSRAATLVHAGEPVRLLIPSGVLSMHAGEIDTGLGWHSPRYGRVEPTVTIAVHWDRSTAPWLVSVFDFNPIDPVVQVDLVPVWAEAGVMAHGAAIRIRRNEWVDYVMFAEAAQPPVAWRVAQFETDARMLLCRVSRTGDVTRLALVDGSFVRSSGRRALSVSLGRVEPAIDIDGKVIRNYPPCAASPAS
jgi:hypothetical protein